MIISLSLKVFCFTVAGLAVGVVLFAARPALAQNTTTGEFTSGPIFYSGFGNGFTPDFAAGSRTVTPNGSVFWLSGGYAGGATGGAANLVGQSSLTYPGPGNFTIGQGTVAFWFYPRWLAGDFTHVLFTLNNQYQQSSDKYFYVGRPVIPTNPNATFAFALESASDSDNQFDIQTSLIVPQQWNHLVITWEYGGTAAVYLNTQYALTTATARLRGSPPSLGQSFAIGDTRERTADFSIDEIMVFSQFVTAAQVQRLYTHGIGAFSFDGRRYVPVQAEPPVVAPRPAPPGQVAGTSTAAYTAATALYKVAGQPDVYAILNGQRHYITSPAAFSRYGYAWGDIQTVSSAYIDQFPSARLLKTPGESTVYYIYQRPQQQWLRLALPSPTAFISYAGNHWGNVAVVDALDIEAYPEARLVKTAEESAVYLIDSDGKHLFLSAAAFESRGYRWAEVVLVSQAHLDSYAVAAPLY